jgi:hypothetical protein
MKMTIERRLERLERGMPGQVGLRLFDGTKRYYVGPPLDLFMRAMDQANSGGGQLVDDMRAAVRATRNFGLLHEVIASITDEGEQHENDHATQPRT